MSAPPICKIQFSGHTLAIRKDFVTHADKLKVFSTKSMTGYLLGASGAAEAAFCLLTLKEQWVTPTAGLKKRDPECELDYVACEGEDFTFDYALSNSLGFGGHNACLAMKR